MPQQTYKARAPFRWAGKQYERGDQLIPENEEQVERANLLVKYGYLAAEIDPNLLAALIASGAVVKPGSMMSIAQPQAKESEKHGGKN